MSHQSVLITGSSRGIGRAIGEKYAENGYNVIFNCIQSKDIMDELVLSLQKQGKNVIGIQADVSDYQQVSALQSKIPKSFGSVDILINNAGVSHMGLFTQMKPSEWQNIINTNLLSVLNCCHVFTPPMIRKHKGAIINISSIWGNVGASCEAVYSASKGGLNSFTKALAKELAPCNIRVNAIACGVIDTQMNTWLSETEKKDLTNDIPIGRFGKAHEIADVAYYLSSEEASYITGQILTVDGGMC